MTVRHHPRRIEGSVVIERPVASVFDFVADERNEPRYNRRMRRVEKVGPGPVGPGTRFRAELGRRSRPVVMDVELTRVDRPRTLGWRARTRSMDVWGRLTFTPVPAGTVLRWSWELEPIGFLRWLAPVALPIGRRQERQVWTGLKRLLEQGAVVPRALPPVRCRAGRADGAAGADRPGSGAQAAAAALVAGSALAGAVYLWRAPADELAALRRQLPWQSPALAALALTGAVAVPFGVATWSAWRCRPSAGAAAVVAGSSLLGWIGLQLAELDERSVLQALFAGVGAGFVVAGARGLWPLAAAEPGGHAGG